MADETLKVTAPEGTLTIADPAGNKVVYAADKDLSARVTKPDGSFACALTPDQAVEPDSASGKLLLDGMGAATEHLTKFFTQAKNEVNFALALAGDNPFPKHTAVSNPVDLTKEFAAEFSAKAGTIPGLCDDTGKGR